MRTSLERFCAHSGGQRLDSFGNKVIIFHSPVAEETELLSKIRVCVLLEIVTQNCCVFDGQGNLYNPVPRTVDVRETVLSAHALIGR